MAVKAKADLKGPHTNIFIDSQFVGSWCVSHQLALDLYDPFDGTKPALMPEVQEIDWDKFIPYGAHTSERLCKCSY